MTNTSLTYEEAMKFQLRRCGFPVEYREYKEDDSFVLEIIIKDKSDRRIFANNFYNHECFEGCYRVAMEYVLLTLLNEMIVGNIYEKE